jgi:YVTN family beta-propeller protein
MFRLMKSGSRFSVAVLAAALSSGCDPKPQVLQPVAAGSLALSKDSAMLYAVDADNGLVAVVDTASKQKVAEVKVGDAPGAIAVAADDTLYVVNKGSRSVSIIRRGEWKEAARLPVGIEPNALALSPDGKKLYVVSAVSRNDVQRGLVSAFDTGTRELLWENDTVGAEPSAIAVISNGKKALVSLSRSAAVSEIDLSTGATVKGADVSEQSTIYDLANGSRSNSSNATFRPRSATALVATPDASRVFMPVTWARESRIATMPSRSFPYYQAAGPCAVGAVTSAGIVTYATNNGTATPKVDDLSACGTRGDSNSIESDFPTSSLVSARPFSRGQVDDDSMLQGPSTGVVDSSGDWLFLVNRDTRNVVVVPTNRRKGTDLKTEQLGSSIRSVVGGLGHGADGIAIQGDGKSLYVYSQFDHQIHVIEASGAGEEASLEQTYAPIKVAQETLTQEAALGRKMFFDALDKRISRNTVAVSCNACHTNGTDDGHVWGFPDGPRQTPSLAGRKMLETAPYHWSGEFASMTDFNAHTIIERMGGSGLNAAETKSLDTYVASLKAPENPMRESMSADALTRGQAAFAKANCSSCHAGTLLTDNTSAKVGTVRNDGINGDNGMVLSKGFNVPSLLGLGRSAPYLHDGSERTLEARVYNNSGDKHGTTSTLSDAEKADLVAYLKSL